MRWSLCLSAAVALTACYASHERSADADPGARDGGAERDSGPDASVACAEGAACDDGDPCTVEDRCRRGRCAGRALECDRPPGACFAASGACVDGACVYAPDDGARCDDGDPCSVDDACEAGECRGAPILCDAPPPPTCVDGVTIREPDAIGTCDAGGCTYGALERPCPDGCVGGACRCVERPWATEALELGVPPSIGRVRHGGVVVDDAGGVHVVSVLQDDGPPRVVHEIDYAHRPAGGTWRRETVAEGRNIRAFAVDGAGRAHVLFHPSPDPAVLATRSASGVWTTTTVDVPAPWIGFGGHLAPAVAIDGDGGLHVAVRFAGGLDGGYGFRPPGGGWAIAEELPSLGGWYPRAIGVDGAGTVRVAYTTDNGVEGDPSRHALGVARRAPDGAWTTEVVATDADGFVGVGIVVGASGDAHLWWTSGTATLHHAWRAGGSWTTEVVAAPGHTRLSPVAVAVGDAGAVHVAYAPNDRAAPELVYLRRDPVSAAWSAHDIALDPLAADVGPHSAGLAADRDGGVHLAYGRLFEPLAYAHRRFCP